MTCATMFATTGHVEAADPPSREQSRAALQFIERTLNGSVPASGGAQVRLELLSSRNRAWHALLHGGPLGFAMVLGQRDPIAFWHVKGHAGSATAHCAFYIRRLPESGDTGTPRHLASLMDCTGDATLVERLEGAKVEG